MIKVNKLAGIVKGIDFDKIINDLERSRLELWADTNRNVATTLQERNLVGLVDDVLEDGIITQEEKQQLLEVCDGFSQVDGTTAALFELSGIVDGVLCDGEVNEKEVRAIDDWIYAHEDLEGNDVYDFVKDQIDEVLEDDIVTSSEKTKLLKKLSSKMENVRFDYFINSLRKKVHRQELIGLDLIGLIDNERVIERIHSRAERELRAALNSYTGLVRDKDIIFISAVLIGLMEYDSSFYNGVEEAYPGLYRDFTKAKIENLFRETLSHYQDQWSDDYEGRIINIALSNAVVPKYYLPAFFEFVFDIYKINLEYSLSDELKDDFRFAFAGLHEKMVNGRDDLSVEVTNKTYKLIKSTKDVIANEDSLDEVVCLSAMVAKIIDEHIWSQDVKLFNPYLKYGYEEWTKKLARDDMARRNKRRQSATRSRWEPSFELQGNTVYLRPPEHRIKDEYDSRDITINVFNGDELVCADCGKDIRAIIGGYRVIVERIALEHPLGQLRYRISARGTVIYDSDEKLHRDILAFNLQGGEVRNNTDFEGSVAVCYRGSCGLQPYYQGAEYNLAVYQASVGDTLVIGDATFNFSARTKPGIQGVTNDKCAIEDPDGVNLRVYSSVAYCIFETEPETSDFEVTINGKRTPLEDFELKTIGRAGFTKYIVAIDGIDAGIYTMVVHELVGASRRAVTPTMRFAVDPGFSAKQAVGEGDEDVCEVEVESSLLPEPRSAQLPLSGFDERWLKFRYRGVDYAYRVALDLDLYRINAGSWTPFSEEIWVGDITNQCKLELFNSDYAQADVFSPRAELLDSMEFSSPKDFRQSVPIGSLLNFKGEHDFVTLRFSRNGERKKRIVCRNRSTMARKDVEFSFDPTDGKLSVSWAYAGRGRVFLRVYDDNDELVFESDQLEQEGTVDVDGLRSFVNYSFVFVERASGLSLNKNREMLAIERSFCAWDDLPGHSFKLAKASFDVMQRGEFSRRSRELRKDYVILRDRLDDGEFQGYIFRWTSREQSLLRHLGAVTVEICGSSADGCPVLAITKDGDGLLLNAEENGVLDSLDDPNAVDIVSYTTQMVQ